MKEVIAYNPPVDWVKSQILNAGTTIGSVHFYKRTDNSLRKMCYRLHVTSPSVASRPKFAKLDTKTNLPVSTVSTDAAGKTIVQFNRKTDRREIDKANNQITVLDANKVVRDESGKVIGRGAWRMIPLEKVVRISNKGTVYTIRRDY